MPNAINVLLELVLQHVLAVAITPCTWEDQNGLEMLEYFVERPDGGTLELRVERFSCPGTCVNTTEVFGIGETEEMMELVTQLRRLPEDVTALAHDLVATEIAHHPNYVGPPVDVIRVGPSGIEWVALKPACGNSPVEAG